MTKYKVEFLGRNNRKAHKTEVVEAGSRREAEEAYAAKHGIDRFDCVAAELPASYAQQLPRFVNR